DGKNQTVTSERVLMAVGVRANIENIGLEGMGVTVDRGFIQVDDGYKTSSPGIWAIGDCAGPPLLAHVAMAEGVRTVEAMAGKHVVPINYDAIPGCTYCDPEVASIGKTEAQAREAGIGYRQATRQASRASCLTSVSKLAAFAAAQMVLVEPVYSMPKTAFPRAMNGASRSHSR